jgi:hypothetical protein
MKIGSFFKHYFSSVLGLLNILLPILTVIAVMAAGFSWSIGVIAALADGFTMFIFAFVSGRGAKAVVGEKDRRILLDYGQNLEKIRALSSGALAIRLVDSGLGKLKDYAALKAGDYAVAAEKENTWDPKVLEAIENILELIDVFQKGADQAATDARFGMESGLSAGDFKLRIADLMKQEILKITDALSSLNPGTVEDRLNVMEDLT